MVCVKLVRVRSWRLNRKQWVDASGKAARVHTEKAVSAEKEQQWQVLMESVGRKSSGFDRASAWKGPETVEKTRKNATFQGRERDVKSGENGDNAASRGEPEEQKRRWTWEDEGG